MALLALVNIAARWEALVTFRALGRIVLEMVAEKGVFTAEVHIACGALRWGLPCVSI